MVINCEISGFGVDAYFGGLTEEQKENACKNDEMEGCNVSQEALEYYKQLEQEYFEETGEEADFTSWLYDDEDEWVGSEEDLKEEIEDMCKGNCNCKEVAREELVARDKASKLLQVVEGKMCFITDIKGNEYCGKFDRVLKNDGVTYIILNFDNCGQFHIDVNKIESLEFDFDNKEKKKPSTLNLASSHTFILEPIGCFDFLNIVEPQEDEEMSDDGCVESDKEPIAKPLDFNEEMKPFSISVDLLSKAKDSRASISDILSTIEEILKEKGDK